MRTSLAQLMVLALLCACATGPVEQSRAQFRNGFGEEALALLDQARKERPHDIILRQEYFRLQELAIAQWLAQADALLDAGRHEAAAALYRRVQKYDPPSARARTKLELLEADLRHREATDSAERLYKAGKHAEAQEALRPVLAENPRHRAAQRLQRLIDERLNPPSQATLALRTKISTPLSIELRDVSLRSVFEALQKTTGISFVFDKDVRTDQRVSVAVRDATLDDALRAILQTNQLEQKRLNETTVLLFPNTLQKRREYLDLMVKSFYLANADAKQTANMMRAILKTRDIFVDEKLNMLVVRDTPSSLRLAERLIATQDLAEPEVMLEVEVLEVSRSRLLDLGMRFPETLAWSLVGAAGIPGMLMLPEWLNRTSSIVQLTFSDPLFALSLRQEDGSTTVLANPRIRVVNKEKARVHIGERVPVITTTAAATGGFVSETVSYLDVGLKLDVEPLIYLDDEVSIKISLEVSNIVREIRSVSGTLTYQIGTRNASTTLRLRDGETQILAGLISDEDRRLANRVPALGDLPAVGRLFGRTNDTNNKTEVMLLITPRLLRTVTRPDVRSTEFPAGPEAAGAGAAMGGIPVPLEMQPAPPRPAAPAPSQPLMQPFGGFKPTPP